MMEMFARLGWAVPDGYAPDHASICRRCTREVLWCRSAGRKVPLNRDGSRHPWECSVGIDQVRAGERGRAPLARCPHCPDESWFSPVDLKLHVETQHRFARPLPRGS